jgi:glycerate kinase
MALRVLIVPDKFKGTLTAQEAADAMAEGWRAARPGDRVQTLPATDGGDGFGAVLGSLLSCKLKTVRTVDAAHRPCVARWWWEPKSRTAVIESAQAIGLAQLPRGKFHPFALDTFGLGKLIDAAAKHGARRCLIGVGGSATNDGGFGLARAIGWTFLDHDGQTLATWTELFRLQKLVPPQHPRRFSHLSVAVDVANPLLGKRGATRIYGPQKGLKPGDFAQAEKNLRRLALVTRKHFARDIAATPGAGAAGGLGFGLVAFLGAELTPGFDLFAKRASLDRHLRQARLVLTGEGAIDQSTLMGKGAGEIARRCRRLKIPCIALAGVIREKQKAGAVFDACHALTELTTPRNAMARPRPWLARLAELAARQFSAEHL